MDNDCIARRYGITAERLAEITAETKELIAVYGMEVLEKNIDNYRIDLTTRYVIRVDCRGYDGRQWWKNGGRALWAKIDAFISPEDAGVASEGEKIASGTAVMRFLVEAEKILGWDDGSFFYYRYTFLVA